jgi:hypothetical protein
MIAIDQTIQPRSLNFAEFSDRYSSDNRELKLTAEQVLKADG